MAPKKPNEIFESRGRLRLGDGQKYPPYRWKRKRVGVVTGGGIALPFMWGESQVETNTKGRRRRR